MLPAESIIYALQRNWDMVDSALEGLDEAAMVRQPSDQCNSAAWILWHMTRVVDMFIHTRLRSIPQLWTQDGWYEKFHMPEDGEDRDMLKRGNSVVAPFHGGHHPPVERKDVGQFCPVERDAVPGAGRERSGSVDRHGKRVDRISVQIKFLRGIGAFAWRK